VEAAVSRRPEPLGPGTATLELACGRCATWWIRWAVDLDVPFDEQRLLPTVRDGVLRVQSPGTHKRATDGEWYRWQPGGPIPAGEHWTRLEFDCPTGCPSDVQAGLDKLYDAAAAALRRLHDTRTPLLPMTVDALLRTLRSSS
jgi:hypothetical protein